MTESTDIEKAVFIRRRPQSIPPYPLKRLFGRTHAPKGQVGLEVECEGNHFRKEDLPQPWEYHEDGSLRGEDNAEYLFEKPISFDKVDEALDNLWGMFRSDGTILDVSNRTSVHVHLNVLNFDLKRLTSFLGLYFSVEEILTAWCGEHREGNLFCLRGTDVPGLVETFKALIKNDFRGGVHDNFHYSGVNPHALPKHGSIEIRTMRGATEPEDIKLWVRVLRRIYDLSGEYRDPRTVVNGYSSSAGGGYMGYLRRVMGEEDLDVILGDIGWSSYRLREVSLRGIRIAQDICYCRDWSLFSERLTEAPAPPWKKKMEFTFYPLADGVEYAPAASLSTALHPE